MSASSSTTGPRQVLIREAVGFISASSRAPISRSVSVGSGARAARRSRIARSRSSSGAERTPSIASMCAGSGSRLAVDDVHVEGAGALGDLGADLAEADQAQRLAAHLLQVGQLHPLEGVDALAGRRRFQAEVAVGAGRGRLVRLRPVAWRGRAAASSPARPPRCSRAAASPPPPRPPPWPRRGRAGRVGRRTSGPA